MGELSSGHKHPRENKVIVNIFYTHYQHYINTRRRLSHSSGNETLVLDMAILILNDTHTLRISPAPYKSPFLLALISIMHDIFISIHM